VFELGVFFKDVCDVSILELFLEETHQCFIKFQPKYFLQS
jgi:hypothetical protein